MQAYTDASRESDPNALPDLCIEHWEDAVILSVDGEGTPYPTLGDATDAVGEAWIDGASSVEIERAEGYYYAACFPGCMPDSDWWGPFDTEEEALAAARSE